MSFKNKKRVVLVNIVNKKSDILFSIVRLLSKATLVKATESGASLFYFYFGTSFFELCFNFVSLVFANTLLNSLGCAIY